MDEAIATARMPRAEIDASGLGSDFASFFAEQHERLFRAVWLLTRSRSDAEEIAQEAFLRLWQRWERIGAHPDPTAYLFRTAMNLWRSRRRRAEVAARKAVQHLRQRDEMADVESRDVVIRALADLPRRQQAAIVLLDVLDLSSSRAGEILDIRPATVRVLAARARATLSRSMGESDG